MKVRPSLLALFIAAAFVAGFFSHLLYRRWTEPVSEGARAYSVRYVSPPEPTAVPAVEAREVEKLKQLAGNRVRVRGRIYRVGHSQRSNTYFLNFGPSRSALTGVIFASAVELFQKKGIDPRSYEGKEVELTGEIRDHPKFGLEIVLEDPSQVKLLN